jgi:hypothetical protein
MFRRIVSLFRSLFPVKAAALYCEHCGNGPSCIVCGRGL